MDVCACRSRARWPPPCSARMSRTPAGDVEYFPDIYGRDDYLGKAFDSVRKVRDASDV